MDIGIASIAALEDGAMRMFFEKLHQHFHAAGEISALLIDSTIVRAHTSAAGAAKKTEDKEIKPWVAATAISRRNSMLR